MDGVPDAPWVSRLRESVGPRVPVQRTLYFCLNSPASYGSPPCSKTNRSGPAEFASAAVASAMLPFPTTHGNGQSSRGLRNCSCYLVGSAVQLVISVRDGWFSAVGAGAI